MEGLQFQIEAASTDASSGIDALAASFTRLKSALGNKKLTSIANKLEAVSRAASGLKGIELEGLSSALNALGSVKISATLPKRLTEIGTAINSLTSEGIDRIERVTKALEGLQGIDLPKVSRAAVSNPVNRTKTNNPVVKTAGTVQAQSSEEIAKTERAGRRLGTVLTSVRNTLTGLSRETLTWSGMAANVSGQYAAAFSDLMRNLEAVKSKFDNTVRSAKEFGRKLSNALNNSAESAGKLKTVLHNAAVQGTEGLATIPLKLPEAFDKISSAIAPLLEKAFGAISSGVSSDLAQMLPGFESLLSSLKPLDAALGGVIEKVGALAGAHPVLAAAIAVVAVAIKGLLELFKEMKRLGSSALNAVKVGFDVLKSAVQKLNTELLTLHKKAFAGLGSALKAGGKLVIGDFVKPFTTAIKTITTWKNALGRIAFYRLVRSAIKEITDGFKTGMDNLYQYSRMVGTQFAPAMDSLAASAQYLKNSLGSMAAPLVQALAPAIDFIIDKFVALLTIIGKVFAALTGKKTFTVAKKAAASYGDAMEGAGDSAKKAAKEIKDATIGIDELNIISPLDDSNAGSGGGGGTNFGDMFEEVEIPSEILDWAAEIKAAIDLGDWRSAGEILARKLNEIVDNWNAYDWGKRLGEKINNALNFLYGFLTTFDFEKLGRKVAEFFNGIFDTVDFDLLGRVFAAKWNALFDFIYGFVTTLNWKKIGLSIAEAINGFIDEIHWARIGEAVSEGLKGIFLMINTALTEIHWDKLAAGIATTFNSVDWYGVIYGALSVIANALAAAKQFIDSFIETFEWSGTARQIYTAINDAFGLVDWGGLGTTLGDAFKAIFNFLRETIAGIDWYEIGKDVARFLNGIDWVGVLSTLTAYIAAGINAAIKAVKGFVENMNIIEIAASFANSVNKLFAGIDWKEAGKTLSNGIEKALNFMIIFMLSVDWRKIGQNIVEFLENIDWDTLLTKWGQLLGELINAKLELIDVLPSVLKIGGNIVKGLLDGVLEEIRTVGILGWLKSKFIGLLINGAMSLLGIHSPSTVFMEIGKNIVEGLLLGITGAWSGLLAFLGGKLSEIKAAFAESWSNIKTTAVETWNGIRTTLDGVWDNLKTAAGTAADNIKATVSAAWDNLKTATAAAWDGIKTTVTQVWENLKTAAKPVFEDIKTTVSTAWDNIKAATSTVWDNIKTTLSTAWDNIRTTASTTFNNVRETISTVWNNLETTTPAVWNTIKTSLETTWNNLKSAASTKFNEIKTTITTAWDNLKTTTSTVWNTIKTSLETMWNNLKAAATAKFNEIKTTISTAWENLKTATSTVWNSIKSTLETAWNNLKSTAATKFNEIKTAITTAWNNVQTTSTTVWNNIKTTLTNLWNGLKTAASTAFEGIKTAITTAWNSIQSTSSTVWNTIKTTLSTIWNGLKTSASTVFNEIKTVISKAWENVKTESGNAWNNIKTTLTNAWNDLKTSATNSFEGIKSAIQNKWNEIVNSASSWGRDLCSNIASGINGAISTVTNAARNVADKVSSYLHFSEPDVGPLSNFHTFMPDMLSLMAKGITDNTYLAENAAYDLTSKVSKILNTGINPALSVDVDTSSLRYFDSEKFTRSISADVESHTDFSSDGFQEAMEDFYREYLQPTINQIAEDMRRQADKDEHPIVQIGGRAITDAVETQQRANGYRFAK